MQANNLAGFQLHRLNRNYTSSEYECSWLPYDGGRLQQGRCSTSCFTLVKYEAPGARLYADLGVQ